MTLVLGVDGGGTKTHALVADDRGEVCGVGLSGPSNWEDVGLGGAGAALRVAVGEALAGAEIQPEGVEASVFGLAGVDWPSDVERLAFAIDPLHLVAPVDVVNDSPVALRAGTERAWGVVVIAGTGSVVAGRSAGGRMFRTLGLGRLFGDFSSSTEVSEEAVRAVANAYIGKGSATTLSDGLCRHFGAATVAELLERLSRQQVQGRVEDEVENVAPLVIAAAAGGDAVARDLLVRVGHGLGESVVLVAGRLDLLEGPFEVVLAGGFLAAAGELVRRPLEQVVRLRGPAATFLVLEMQPVVGAALLALELAGLEVAPGVRERLAEGWSARAPETA